MRTMISPKLTVLETIPSNLSAEQRTKLAAALKSAGIETEPYAALALGQTAVASMEALAAIKTGRMEAIGQDPKLVSPVKAASVKQYIRRADGQVVKFTFGLPITHKIAGTGETVEVL